MDVFKQSMDIENMRISMLATAAAFDEKGKSTSGLHCHHHFEMHFICGGEFQFDFDRGRVSAHSNTLIIVSPGIYHAVTYSENRIGTERVSFEISFTRLRHGKDIFDSYVSLFESVKDFTVIDADIPEFRKIYEYFGKSNSTEAEYSVKALSTLCFFKICDLLRERNQVEATDIPQGATFNEHSGDDLLMIKVFAFIHNHYETGCTLSDLSEELHLSQRQTERIIKKNMGKPFLALVNEHRIKAAQKLIVENRLSLDEICHKVGFESYSSFWGQFKKETGCTPSEYKSKR